MSERLSSADIKKVMVRDLDMCEYMWIEIFIDASVVNDEPLVAEYFPDGRLVYNG